MKHLFGLRRHRSSLSNNHPVWNPVPSSQYSDGATATLPAVRASNRGSANSNNSSSILFVEHFHNVPSTLKICILILSGAPWKARFTLPFCWWELGGAQPCCPGRTSKWRSRKLSPGPEFHSTFITWVSESVLPLWPESDLQTPVQELGCGQPESMHLGKWVRKLCAELRSYFEVKSHVFLNYTGGSTEGLEIASTGFGAQFCWRSLCSIARLKLCILR